MRRSRETQTGMPRRTGALAGLLTVAAGVCIAASGQATASALPASAGPSAWTVYQGGAAGPGVAAGVGAVDTVRRAWTSRSLDGQLYGQPLVFDHRVYVATESDTVYALSAGTGRVIWSAHLGRAVPAGRLPCGNIAPTVGITGTPVIDPARDEIFVVADEVLRGAPAHILVGLAAASGKTELRQDVDPRRANPAALLQRTGLTIANNRVYFGFGGHYGDCGSYRGRLVGVPESGGKVTYFTVDSAPGESQGAIWMGGGAPAVDSQGNLWVTTGNGSVHSGGHAYDHSDGLLEFSPSLRLLQFFAPRHWASNNAQDLDLSTEPALLSDGEVVVAGKNQTVYLLSRAHLGGIGRQQATLRTACGNDIDGGMAVTGTTVFLPCLNGTVAVKVTKPPHRLRLLWSSGAGGGPPVLAGGLVWTIGQNGKIYGLSPANGKVRQVATLGVPANHFPAPAVAGGLLLATSAKNVVAFRTSSSAAQPARPPATPARVIRHPPAAAAATLPWPGIAAIIAAVVAAAGGGWWLSRHRSRPGGAAALSARA